MAKPATDLYVEADLFGTFRVTLFWRNADGSERSAIVHGVEQEAVDAAVEAFLAAQFGALRELVEAQ